MDNSTTQPLYTSYATVLDSSRAHDRGDLHLIYETLDYRFRLLAKVFPGKWAIACWRVLLLVAKRQGIHQERRYFAFMSSHDLGAAIGKLTVTDAFYRARASRRPRLVHVVITPYFDAGRPEAPLLTLRRDAPSSDIHPHVSFCCCRLNALASAFLPSFS